MDGERRTYYGDRFEGIRVSSCGKLVGALISNPREQGARILCVSEEYLLRYVRSRQTFLNDWPVPDDIAQRVMEDIEMYEFPRNEIQEYKLKKGISLDTPLMAWSMTTTASYDAAANEPTFSP